MRRNYPKISIHIGINEWSTCYFDCQSQEIYAIRDNDFNVFPSIIAPSWKSNDDEILFVFGKPAENMKYGQINYVENIVQFVGKPYSEIPEEIIENSNCPIIEDQDGNCVFMINHPKAYKQYQFSAKELFKIQLTKIKELILNRSQHFDSANLSVCVPTIINEIQKEEIRKAFKEIGLRVGYFIEEPCASVYEYQYFKKQKLGTTLVVDIEQNEMNVSICEEKDEEITLMCSERYPRFGKQIFIELLMSMIVEQLETYDYENVDDFRINGNETQQRRLEKMKCIQKLKNEAERIFEVINSRKVSFVDTERICSNNSELIDDDVVIVREEFEHRIREVELLTSIRNNVNEVLRRANFRTNHIESVILLGPTMNIPIIREHFNLEFGKNKIKSFDRQYEKEERSIILSKGSLRNYHYISRVILNNERQARFTVSMKLNEYKSIIAKRGTELPIQYSTSFLINGNQQREFSFDIVEYDSEFGETCIDTYYIYGKDIPKRNEVIINVSIQIGRNKMIRIDSVIE